MRILWITHDPIRTAIGQGHSSSGFWKESLLKLLKEETADEITVAFPGNEKKLVAENTYNFRYHSKKVFKNLPLLSESDLLWIISECKPDLIHIHGTEIPYGLLAKKTKIPIVISLQGFISECYNLVLGDIALPVWSKEKTLKEYILKNSFIDMHNQWYQNSDCEIETVRVNKYFIGRTQFDRHFVAKHNAAAIYFSGNELLRDEFYNKKWDLQKINRHSIYSSSFTNPLKGFHILLRAAGLLIQEFPDLNITVPGILTEKMSSRIFGNSYFRMIRKLIDTNHLEKHIKFAGKLEGKEITSILQHTHLFALPSLMENSSNALGEAQITGIPCVASDCGGTPSIIKDGENGLLFSKGDAYELATQIRKVFLNDQLAEKLSTAARLNGSEFHSRSKILSQYSSIYKNILTFENTI